MAAALLPGLLLLALSLDFPLASADMKTLPLDLPSTMFLKPRQSSTRVTFKVLFQNTTDQEASFPLDKQWYKVELFRNDAQNVVLRVSSYPDKEFTCCAGQKLLNHHASYEGLADWSEECPDEVPQGSLFSCPGMESNTADPPSTQQRGTQTPSTQQPDSKAPSTENPDGKSLSTENLDQKPPSTENLDPKIPSTDPSDSKVHSTHHSDSNHPSTERLATKAPSTQDPDAKAPSEASSQESSSSTEDPVGVSVLLFAIAVAGMLLLL